MNQTGISDGVAAQVEFLELRQSRQVCEPGVGENQAAPARQFSGSGREPEMQEFLDIGLHVRLLEIGALDRPALEGEPSKTAERSQARQSFIGNLRFMEPDDAQAARMFQSGKGGIGHLCTVKLKREQPVELLDGVRSTPARRNRSFAIRYLLKILIADPLPQRFRAAGRPVTVGIFACEFVVIAPCRRTRRELGRRPAAGSGLG